MVTGLMAWEVICLTGWSAVPTGLVAKLLHFFLRSITVSDFTIKSANWLFQHWKESFLTQPLLPPVLYLRNSALSASLRRTLAKY